MSFVLEGQDEYRPLSEWDSPDLESDRDPEEFNRLISEETEGGDIDTLVADTAFRFNIPVENVIVENGVIARIIDSDGEVINADSGLLDAPAATDENTESDEPDGENQEPADETENEGLLPNVAIQTAQQLGLDVDRMVDSEGNAILFSDMDTESQMLAVRSMVEMAVNVDPFEDATERHVIEALRSGRSLLEISREIVSGDGKYLADTLDDYSVYAHQVQRRDPSMSAEDIREEFDALPDGLRDRKVASYRERMRTEDPSSEVLNRLTQESEESRTQEYQQTLVQFQQVIEQIGAQGSIDGVEVSSEVLDDLYQYITAPSPETSSQFIEALSDPAQIAQAAFWHRNIESYRKSVNEYVSRLDRENAELRVRLGAETETNRRLKESKTQSPKKAETWTKETSSALPDGVKML